MSYRFSLDSCQFWRIFYPVNWGLGIFAAHTLSNKFTGVPHPPPPPRAYNRQTKFKIHWPLKFYDLAYFKVSFLFGSIDGYPVRAEITNLEKLRENISNFWVVQCDQWKLLSSSFQWSLSLRFIFWVCGLRRNPKVSNPISKRPKETLSHRNNEIVFTLFPRYIANYTTKLDKNILY